MRDDRSSAGECAKQGVLGSNFPRGRNDAALCMAFGFVHPCQFCHRLEIIIHFLIGDAGKPLGLFACHLLLMARADLRLFGPVALT